MFDNAEYDQIFRHIYLKKQSAESARFLTAPDAVDNIRLL